MIHDTLGLFHVLSTRATGDDNPRQPVTADLEPVDQMRVQAAYPNLL